MTPPTAAELLSALNERIARQYETIQRIAAGTIESAKVESDPSDAGPPPGAPRPIPVPPELLATLRHAVNEEEAAQEIREIRSGGGRTLDQFIGKLEALARQPGNQG